MTFLFVCIATLFVVPLALGQDATLAAEYSSFKQLVSPSYELYWNFDAATQNLSIAVRVQTTGYIGFGISPNGGMPNSDVVIGWVAGGMTCFHDRKVPNAQTLPKIDDEQNWFLIEGTEDNGWTTLKFWRLLDTGDSSEDIVIGEGNTRVIYSWNDADPSDASSPDYHMSNRGSIGVTFVETSQVVEDMNGAKTLLILQDNVEIPAKDTTYWCSGVRLPVEFQRKEQHMIRFAPVIHEPSKEFVHHVVLYNCPVKLKEDLDKLTREELKGVDCSMNRDKVLSKCRGGANMAAWAVGGGPYSYPSGVSYSIGGPSESGYLVIEMHYDNPNKVSGATDSSGLNISYITTGRKYNAGTLAVGHSVTPNMIVPPGVSKFTIFGTCDSSCTSKHIPCEGLNVFANLLHTHLAGVALTLKVIRDGKALDPPLDQELNYDFNFQETRSITPTTIYPGDSLLLECVYQTNTTNNVLVGGLATSDEMCVAFLNYYPRLDFSSCLSYPTDLTTFKFLEGLTHEKQQEIKRLSNMYPGDAKSQVNNFVWDNQSLHSLEVAYKEKYNVYCGPNLQEALCGSGAGVSAAAMRLCVIVASITTVLLWNI